MPVPLNGAVVRGASLGPIAPPDLHGAGAVEGIAGGPLLLERGRPVRRMRDEDFWGTAPPVTFSQDETGGRNLLPRHGVEGGPIRVPLGHAGRLPRGLNRSCVLRGRLRRHLRMRSAEFLVTAVEGRPHTLGNRSHDNDLMLRWPRSGPRSTHRVSVYPRRSEARRRMSLVRLQLLRIGGNLRLRGLAPEARRWSVFFLDAAHHAIPRIE